MHRVLSVCDKSMRFDIFTAKDHRNKVGYEVNWYFILAYFRTNYKKKSRKLPENSSEHVFVRYNILIIIQ